MNTNVPLEDDKLLTAKDLARILGVDSTTIQNWVRAGQIPSVKLSARTRRFRRSAVEEWLRQSEQGTPNT
jgi:excisionase family DNA binding protein